MDRYSSIIGSPHAGVVTSPGLSALQTTDTMTFRQKNFMDAELQDLHLPGLSLVLFPRITPQQVALLSFHSFAQFLNELCEWHIVRLAA